MSERSAYRIEAWGETKILAYIVIAETMREALGIFRSKRPDMLEPVSIFRLDAKVIEG